MSPRAEAITYGFVDSNNTFSNTGAFIVKSPTTGQIFPTFSSFNSLNGGYLRLSQNPSTGTAEHVSAIPAVQTFLP
jgi:hypothetical protein